MNRTERKEIEIQVREIICQMKEKQKQKPFFVNVQGTSYNRVRYSPGTGESGNKPYFKIVRRYAGLDEVFFYYV